MEGLEHSALKEVLSAMLIYAIARAGSCIQRRAEQLSVGKLIDEEACLLLRPTKVARDLLG